MKDLIILVADLDTENVLLGLLPRLVHVYGAREFLFDIKRHPYRDPGCATTSADFLRPFSTQYRHALVVFDREGSGKEKWTRTQIEEKIEKELAENGWQAGLAAVIAIDPEVENWVWINSPRVSGALNWKDAVPLYDWLRNENLLREDSGKPERPKETFEKALKKTRKAKSASIYRQIAASASFAGCTDDSFKKMIAVLKEWFVADDSSV